MNRYVELSLLHCHLISEEIKNKELVPVTHLLSHTLKICSSYSFINESLRDKVVSFPGSLFYKFLTNHCIWTSLNVEKEEYMFCYPENLEQIQEVNTGFQFIALF